MLLFGPVVRIIFFLALSVDVSEADPLFSSIVKYLCGPSCNH
jgi:hypothetical protein